MNNLSDYLKEFLKKFNIEDEEEINKNKNTYVSLKISGSLNNSYLYFRNFGFDTFHILK